MRARCVLLYQGRITLSGITRPVCSGIKPIHELTVIVPLHNYLLATCYDSQSDVFWNIPKNDRWASVKGEECAYHAKGQYHPAAEGLSHGSQAAELLGAAVDGRAPGGVDGVPARRGDGARDSHAALLVDTPDLTEGARGRAVVGDELRDPTGC